MKPRHFFVQDPAEKGFFYSFNVRVTGRMEWQQVRADLETKILVLLLASPAAVEFNGLAANVHVRRWPMQ